MTASKTSTTRAIHWLSALLIISLLASGLYMSDGHDYSMYDWHKSFGVIALAFIVFRLYYKVKAPWQSSAEGTPQQTLVKVAHYLLLSASVLMPLSGMVYSGLGGYGVELFGISIIPNNYNAAGQAEPFSQLGSEFGEKMHEYLGYAFIVLVSLHLLAALKHHFVDKDHTLKRMLSSRYTRSEDP